MIGDWLDIGPVGQIAPGTARTLAVQGGAEIAVFHTLDDRFYALVNACPHKRGPLSQGIVHGAAVTCPLHNWVISLETGQALGADKGSVRTIPVRNENGMLSIALDSMMMAAE